MRKAGRRGWVAGTRPNTRLRMPRSLPWQDANDELVIATDPRLATVTGSYFVSKASWPAPRAAYDADTQRRLWEVMERQTGARYSV